MCVTSMIGDHYRDMWQPKPWFEPATTPAVPMPGLGQPNQIFITQPPVISREEFDELKRQVLEMKELLKRAKDYDEKNAEPDCEIDEKMKILAAVAKLVGVELSDVLKHAGSTDPR